MTALGPDDSLADVSGDPQRFRVRLVGTAPQQAGATLSNQPLAADGASVDALLCLTVFYKSTGEEW